MGRATRFGVQITVQRYLEESSSTEKGRRENTGKTEAYVSRLNRKHREFSWFRPVAPAQPSRAVPIMLDGLLVAVVLAYSLPGAVGVSRSLGWSPLVGVILTLGMCVPWVGRQRYPLTVFLVICGCGAAQAGFWGTALTANVMLLPAVYNLATRFSLIASVLGAILAAGVIWTGVIPQMRVITSDRVGTGTLLSAMQAVLAAWLIGVAVRVRRAHIASLEERALQLEREKETQAIIIAAQERANIAREIHDVISHSLSAVVMMIDGAAAQVPRDPKKAVATLERSSELGRGAMAELRRMVTLLRASPAKPLSPQPGLGNVASLIEASQAAGIATELQVTGSTSGLSSGLELCVYRIIQEALTNTRKHGGPGVSAVSVGITVGESDVTVRIEDDGQGPGQWEHEASGHGLVGMRERVAIYGGRVHIGARVGGGFQVVACIPIEGAR